MILMCPSAELPWKIVNHKGGGSERGFSGVVKRRRIEKGKG
jgi:hypothetical protein